MPDRPPFNDDGQVAVLQARIRQLEQRLARYEPAAAYRLWLEGPQRVLSPEAVKAGVERLLTVCPEHRIKASAPDQFACAVLPEVCSCRELLLGLADACQSPDPQTTRKRFVNYYEEGLRRLVASGITQEQLAELEEFGLLAKDNVTGFWEGRSGKGRFWTLQQAIQHVKETNEVAVYVDMDLKNLGGLNAALGSAMANEVYSEIAAAARRELSDIASDSTFFRHGGDETSSFLIDTTERAVLVALAVVQDRVATLAKKYGVDRIPHPKHQGDRQIRGIGLHYGICRIQPEHEADPAAIFRHAEADLERRRRPGALYRPSNFHP
jgi:GGDEF domain-containing protein